MELFNTKKRPEKTVEKHPEIEVKTIDLFDHLGAYNQDHFFARGKRWKLNGSISGESSEYDRRLTLSWQSSDIGKTIDTFTDGLGNFPEYPRSKIDQMFKEKKIFLSKEDHDRSLEPKLF